MAVWGAKITSVSAQAKQRAPRTREADHPTRGEQRAGDITKDVRITSENFDVIQVVALPVGGQVQVTTEGKGEAVLQAVSRYNLAQPDEASAVFDISVGYNTARVDVSDIVVVRVSVTFDPPQPVKASRVRPHRPTPTTTRNGRGKPSAKGSRFRATRAGPQAVIWPATRRGYAAVHGKAPLGPGPYSPFLNHPAPLFRFNISSVSG